MSVVCFVPYGPIRGAVSQPTLTCACSGALKSVDARTSARNDERRQRECEDIGSLLDGGRPAAARLGQDQLSHAGSDRATRGTKCALERRAAVRALVCAVS